MNPIVAIVVEDVIRKQSGGAPIPEGLKLCHALSTQYKIAFITDSDNDQELRNWLNLNGMYKCLDYVRTSSFARRLWADDSDVRLQQLSDLRQVGPVELVVESNPGVAVSLITAGFNVLTFSHAAYAFPEWRPDYNAGPKPWDAVVAEVKTSNAIKLTDERLKDRDI